MASLASWWKKQDHEKRVWADTATDKQCRGCREVKPLADFGRNDRMTSGRSSHCKECNRVSRQRSQAIAYARDPLQNLNKGHKRRAKVHAGPGVTADDIARIHAAQRGKCAICGVRLNGRWHQDHIVALSRGGLHEPRNIQLTCGPCNQSKGARDPIDHMQSLGRLL